METILKTTKLIKTFQVGGAIHKILKDIDLQIYKGDFTVIMGPSGSGKSTLLYSLSGMDKPSSGEIIYGEGANIATLKEDELADFRARHCGFIFQQIYLVDSMTIFDNVLLSGLLTNKNKTEVINNTIEALNKVGITKELYNKFPSMISGGEAQRVGVARAIVSSPALLFADEPTGALNSKNAQAVLDIMTTLNQAGQSVVMVTHDINSALRADRIMYLKDGRIEGELRLNKYAKDDEERKEKVRLFLAKLGW